MYVAFNNEMAPADDTAGGRDNCCNRRALPQNAFESEKIVMRATQLTTTKKQSTVHLNEVLLSNITCYI